jgi:hypothetical protein
MTSATGPTLHHLPPLYRTGDQVTIELHLHPFARNYDHLGLNDIWQNSQPLGGVDGLRSPSIADQIIINVIHTLLHGLAKERFTLSLRDLFEGRLLFKRATDADRDRVRTHFQDRGYAKDFELWLYLCKKIFDVPDIGVVETRFHKDFFDQLIEGQSDPSVRFKNKLKAKIRNFIFLELTNPRRLRNRVRHFMSAAFWRRVSNSYKNSRSGRN